jgi:hypothetical protein
MPEPTRHLLLVEDEAALREPSPSSHRPWLPRRTGRFRRNGDRTLADFASTSSSPTCAFQVSTDLWWKPPRPSDIIAIVITGYGTVRTPSTRSKTRARP